MAMSRLFQTRFLSQSAALRRGMAQFGQELKDVYYPNALYKKILIWGRIYKNAAEIPETVSLAQMRKALDVVRAKGNFLTCVAGVIGCGLIIYSQKELRRRRIAAMDGAYGE